MTVAQHIMLNSVFKSIAMRTCTIILKMVKFPVVELNMYVSLPSLRYLYY